MVGYKGFTLIELLAVITIVGILMMVAIPAVSKTVDKARNDTAIRNVKSFVKETNKEILDQSSVGRMIEDGTYMITPEGNICLDKSATVVEDCDPYTFLEIDFESGKKVTSGIIKIVDGKVANFYNIRVMDRYVNVKNKDKYYVSFEEQPVGTPGEGSGSEEPSEPVEEKTCMAVSGEASHAAGTLYSCEVRDGVKYNFYLLSTGGGVATMIMDRNIIESVAWHDHGTGRNVNNCGPTTAYETLHSLTAGWNKLLNISIDYVDPNYPDIKFMTREEDVTIMSKDPECDMYEVNFSNLKARLPFSSELGSGDWMYVNLDGWTDYWANESITRMGNYAAVTLNGGSEVLGQGNVGIRPVVQVNLSDLG